MEAGTSEGLLYLLLAGGIAFFFLSYVFGSKRDGLKPVPKALVLPLIGDSASQFKDAERLVQRRLQTLGPIYESWMFGERLISIARPDLVKWCLHNGEPEVMSSEWPKSTRVLLGQYGLVNIVGARHAQLRKILKPAFSLGAINEFAPSMAGVARRCCDKWAGQGRVGGMLAAKEYTFLIALELILGFDESLLTEETINRCTAAFIDWNDGLFSFPLDLPGTAYHRGLKARATLLSVLDANMDILRAKMATQQRDGEGKVAEGGFESCAEQLMRIRDKEGKGLLKEEIMDLCLTLLFAGHDTSAHTIVRLFSELPRHPAVWERMAAEQQQVIAEQGAEINGAALKGMTYLDAVIREILRLHPIVGGAFRKAIKDFDLGGYRIPKGRKLFLNIGQTMKYDERWAGQTGPSSPTAFNPDRWMSEEGQKTGAWMPFGGGPRLCLGYLLATAEIKVFLAVLVRGYSFKPVDLDEAFTTWPVGGEPVAGLLMDIHKK